MPSAAFVRFIERFELDFDRWHDGEGFDLEALAQIDKSDEKGDVRLESAPAAPPPRAGRTRGRP
jgi:hypothetical protein